MEYEPKIKHFFKVLRLYLEARIRIHIKVKGWIRIRIRIKVKGDPHQSDKQNQDPDPHQSDQQDPYPDQRIRNTGFFSHIF